MACLLHAEETGAFPEAAHAFSGQSSLQQPTSKHKGVELTSHSAHAGARHARLHEASSREADFPVRGPKGAKPSPSHRGDPSGHVEEEMAESLLPEPQYRESIDGPAVMENGGGLQLPQVGLQITSLASDCSPTSKQLQLYADLGHRHRWHEHSLVCDVKRNKGSR